MCTCSEEKKELKVSEDNYVVQVVFMIALCRYCVCRLKKEFLELVKSLCQDLNHEVRRMMALQMHSFCVGLG